MDWLNWQVAQGILRHLLTAVGSTLVAGGWLTDGDVQTGIGAILALIGIIAGVLSSRTKQKAIEAAGGISVVKRNG